MKNIKPLFEFFKFLFQHCVLSVYECCAGHFNKGLPSKIKILILLSAIFVPCFLQFPSVLFGQDRPDSINGHFVFCEGSAECIKSERPITHGGNFIGKGTFEFNNGTSDYSLPISFNGEEMVYKWDNKDKNSGQRSSVQPSFLFGKFDNPFNHGPGESFLYWFVIWGLSLFSVCMTTFNKNDAQRSASPEPRHLRGPCVGGGCAIYNFVI
jgi:hypothetical protein